MKMELSGRGFKLTKPVEIKYENILLNLDSETQLFEIISDKSDKIKEINHPIGWLVIGKGRWIGDYVAHSSSGMRGKSVNIPLGDFLTVDNLDLFKAYIPNELSTFEIQYPTQILENILTNFRIRTGIEELNWMYITNNPLLLVYTSKNDLFVQDEKYSFYLMNEEITILELKREKVINLTLSNRSV